MVSNKYKDWRVQTNNDDPYLSVCQVDLKMAQIAEPDMPQFQLDAVVELPIPAAD